MVQDMCNAQLTRALDPWKTGARAKLVPATKLQMDQDGAARIIPPSKSDPHVLQGCITWSLVKVYPWCYSLSVAVETSCSTWDNRTHEAVEVRERGDTWSSKQRAPYNSFCFQYCFAQPHQNKLSAHSFCTRALWVISITLLRRYSLVAGLSDTAKSLWRGGKISCLQKEKMAA